MSSVDQIHSALTGKYAKKHLKIKAGQLIRRPEFQKMDLADIEQHLACHVLEQANKYDPKRSAPNTFISRMVETAIALLIRDHKRLKRACGIRTVSLDSPYLSSTMKHKMSLINIISESDQRRHYGGHPRDSQRKVELSTDIMQAFEGLTDLQLEIAKYLAITTEASISRVMAISRRQVRKEVLAIRKHFQKLGLGED